MHLHDVMNNSTTLKINDCSMINGLLNRAASDCDGYVFVCCVAEARGR